MIQRNFIQILLYRTASPIPQSTTKQLGICNILHYTKTFIPNLFINFLKDAQALIIRYVFNIILYKSNILFYYYVICILKNTFYGR